ncbi:MAG TPA: TadE/TadG family type IV pilus assembly protein [Bryobacteraceae bacterium]|nr:TadE/TadG family type IV pilus assembly protein [Bryobacteraceae bacterium]
MPGRFFEQRGNATIEFTLVGIPLIFALISIFEVSRGMWIYVTLAQAVREGTRYAIVHGQNCSQLPNQCATTVAQVAARIRDMGVGLLPNQLTVTMSTAAGGASILTIGPSTLETLLTQTGTTFPAGAGSGPGSDIVITASYPFNSAIAMFFPGAGSGMTFGTFNLPASSRDIVQF